MEELINGITKEMNQRIQESVGVRLIASSLYKYMGEFVLKELGYSDWEPCDVLLLDESKKNDHMWVHIKSDNKLFIRVNSYNQVETGEIRDFIKTIQAEYAKERKVEWGILTDCAKYILINAAWSDVNRSMESVVLKVDLIKKDHWKSMLKYFSYNNLFESQNTRYFLEIAKFRMRKALKSEASFETYKSTLYNFFDFYAERHSYVRTNIGYNNPLEAVSYEVFRSFIIDKERKGKLLTENTIKNNYSHISGMFKGLGISNANFYRDRDLKTKEFEVSVKEKNTSFFSIENVERVMEFLDDGKCNSDRNVILFYLFVYMGIERSAVLDLKWNDFDMKRSKYIKNNAEIDMPKSFMKRLEKFKKVTEDKNNKIPFVFTTYHKGEYKIPSASTVNNMFIRLKDIAPQFEGIYPQYLRKELAVFLFDKQFSLEEICYLMNISIANILNYIPEDKIMEKGEKRLKQQIKTHPFWNLLD